MSDAILAADLGGTKIAVARVRRTGTLTHRRAAPTPAEGGEAVVQALVGMLRSLPQSGAAGVAVDVPGLAYRDGAVWAPNIPGWERMPLRQLLRRQLRMPVLIESDRNAFVVGEAWRGAARSRRDAVFLMIGTGIGAGILAGGRLVRGHGELAGALGWLAIRDQYRPEYASVGCAEAHVAGPALGIHATELLGSPTTARELVALARQGNVAAGEVIERAGYDLGLVLANIVSTLNPEVIVVGGGVAAAGEMLLRPARSAMVQWAQPLAGKQVRVVRSRLGADAGLLGVAKLAFDEMGTSGSVGSGEGEKRRRGNGKARRPGLVQFVSIRNS